MKLLHVITALNFGGAEAMLSKLVGEHRANPAFPDSAILSLLPLGRVGRALAASGAPVESLELQNVWQLPSVLPQLMTAVRRHNPDVVQGWMYHGNLATLATQFTAAKKPALIWNIRHSLNDLRAEKRSSRIVIRLNALFSGRPRTTIYNSAAAMRQHVAHGFSPDGAVVIPNGFDCERFRPDTNDRKSRAHLARAFGIPRAPILAAMVARQHPMKDHATAIEAVGRARQAGHDIHLLLAGSGMDRLPFHLASALRHWLPENRLTLLGDRDDVADWLPGCDVLLLSSAWGEGFPNILGEAMASNVPCIATDVGDSGMILGDGGICVPARDPAAMSAALAALCAGGPEVRQSLGRRGRERILAQYSLHAVARRYAELYELALPAAAGALRSREASACAG